MALHLWKIFCRIWAGLAVALACSSPLWAAPLDDLSVQEQGDAVVITIRLTDPVRLLRFSPSGKTRYLEIFYERMPNSGSSENWLDLETRNWPATTKTPAFTVTTRDQTMQPKLVVEFASEVASSVSPGADGRSLLITIKPERNEVIISNGHGKCVTPDDETCHDRFPHLNPLPEGEEANESLREFHIKESQRDAHVNGSSRERHMNIDLPFLPDVFPPKLDPTAAEASNVEGGAATIDYNPQAYALMLTGRNALSARNYLSAVDSFNRLLLLPPNQYTQDAQEWVGVARERSNSKFKTHIVEMSLE